MPIRPRRKVTIDCTRSALQDAFDGAVSMVQADSRLRTMRRIGRRVELDRL